jgi:hypothetical protein
MESKNEASEMVHCAFGKSPNERNTWSTALMSHQLLVTFNHRPDDPKRVEFFLSLSLLDDEWHGLHGCPYM